ncbi:DUF2613 family protein [Rhodococcus sp. PAMC28707]|uniref:DUF2613 domain-containing protein n=1 Tax=unclassified Rhodococcus (in: high G+C Gram-positive bacteria) TaxID=192944 RepID=UPI00109E30BD|nr:MULTISPECIES: DUF2613 domain-containing protein [unclassified Rhodococcus (in: high G+C Gram-positive bacteria)]QCB49815.1 DUF2613 family protein [Rhodococcus sp. PAMC28705]QCB58492.1 DUF2613 family protein [Rhodococcus sp. PAMC28707]
MKFAVPGIVAAVVGAVLGVGVVLGVTAAASDNTRPEIDRTGNADSSLLNQVEYGSR